MPSPFWDVSSLMGVTPTHFRASTSSEDHKVIDEGCGEGKWRL